MLHDASTCSLRRVVDSCRMPDPDVVRTDSLPLQQPFDLLVADAIRSDAGTSLARALRRRCVFHNAPCRVVVAGRSDKTIPEP